MTFASDKGHGFTADEAKQYVKQKAAAKGKVIGDAELDGVPAARAACWASSSAS